MADALNQRIHHDTIDADASTITGPRGHRIAVGDLILTRHNDASIPLRNPDDPAAEQSPVRNGQRWQVTAINAENNRHAARRLEDNTLGVFFNDYVRDHITYGYTVTVHCAQGVTADTTHAVLSETATRALSYVAMTRGRHTNTAYFYQRTREHEYRDESTQAGHVTSRGGSQHAARLLRAIIANDEHLMTAHGLAAATAQSLPAQVQRAIKHRAVAIGQRAAEHQRWRAAAAAVEDAAAEARSRDIGRDRSIDGGFEL